MLKNYIKIAFRNLTRYKVYSFINIFGLSIGMGVCILIFLFISNELSYDKFHEKSDRTFRVSRLWTDENGEVSLHLGHVAPPFAPLLENDFPDVVEHSIRMLSGGGGLFSYEDKKILEQNVLFVDKDFFNVFSFKLLEGDAETALSEANAVVLTKKAAERYFGKENAIGKTLRYDDKIELKVTGVTEEVPSNSQFDYEILVSFLQFEAFYGRERLMSSWGNNSFSTYLVLKEGYDPEELEAQFPAFLDKHMGDYNGIPVSAGTQVHLWPLTDIHLYSNLDSEIEPNGKIEYVYIYGIIGLFILLIACINFMNLSTARSARRSKEVGLRNGRPQGFADKTVLKRIAFNYILRIVISTYNSRHMLAFS